MAPSNYAIMITYFVILSIEFIRKHKIVGVQNRQRRRFILNESQCHQNLTFNRRFRIAALVCSYECMSYIPAIKLMLMCG